MYYKINYKSLFIVQHQLDIKYKFKLDNFKLSFNFILSHSPQLIIYVESYFVSKILYLFKVEFPSHRKSYLVAKEFYS